MTTLSEVQDYLRQKKATGRLSPGEMKKAYEAYFTSESNKALERSKLAINQDQFDENLALNEKTLSVNQDQFDRNLALQEQQMADAEDAAKVSGITQLGMMGAMASDTTLGKAVIGGVKTGAQKAVSALGSGTTGGAQKAVTGLAPLTSTTSTAATTAATASPTIGAGLAGGNPGLASLSTTAPTTAAPTAGLGVASGAALTVGAYYAADALTGDKVKESGSIAAGATAGALIGGPVGAVVGGVIGFAADKVLDATWLCTATKDTVGLTELDIKTLTEFKGKVSESHPDWLKFYLDIGPELIKSINGDVDFFESLKEDMIYPVILLTQEGYDEAAYAVYKQITVGLIKKYKPDLMEQSPQGGK